MVYRTVAMVVKTLALLKVKSNIRIMLLSVETSEMHRTLFDFQNVTDLADKEVCFLKVAAIHLRGLSRYRNYFNAHLLTLTANLYWLVVELYAGHTTNLYKLMAEDIYNCVYPSFSNCTQILSTFIR